MKTEKCDICGKIRMLEDCKFIKYKQYTDNIPIIELNVCHECMEKLHIKLSNEELNMMINKYNPTKNEEEKAVYLAACELKKLRDKEKPEVPNLEGDGYDPDGNLIYDTWECPGCGKLYELEYEEYDYCPKCGQHIDWRGVEKDD